MCVNILLWKSNPSPERKIPVGGSDAEDVTEECGTWKKGQYLNKLKCSNFIYMLSSVQLLGRVRLFATPWITAWQASLSITNSCAVFPAPLIEEAIFVLLYILASFVKNKVPIGAWVYFWAFYWSTGLYFCFCASTILSWWLQLCSIVWSQEGWFLQLLSAFSRLLRLFGVFCVSILNVKFFVLVLWKMPLVIW